jgi:hypothetical protein
MDTMQPHRDIVQGDADARRDLFTRLPHQIHAPDHVGIFRLERGQKLVEAVAHRLVELLVSHDVQGLKIVGIHHRLSLPPPDGPTLMVDDGRGADPAQPAKYRTYIAQLARSLDSPEHECLQDVFGRASTAHSSLQELQDLPTALDERLPYGGIGRLRCRLVLTVGARAFFWNFASHRQPNPPSDARHPNALHLCMLLQRPHA